MRESKTLMMDEFDQILSLFAILHERFPHLRLCQIIGNVRPGDIYYVKDNELLSLLREYYKIHGNVKTE